MANPLPTLPSGEQRPIDVILTPIHRFLKVEAAGGILLLACTVVALIWANSPWREAYDHFWHTYVRVGFSDHVLSLSLAHFVNDGLMAIFFFVVGLEIKRELYAGELASPRKAIVPIVAAAGGMAAPALVYAAFTAGGDGEQLRGWAIPMATDIAFAVGIMAMLGKRVPLSLKVFLTALAIVDDIGAVIVIAVFYSGELSKIALGLAVACLALSALANRLGVRRPLAYGVIGVAMWLALLESGVHATVGGVLLALTIPAQMRIGGRQFTTVARKTIDAFTEAGGDADDLLTNPKLQHSVHTLEVACERVQTPLGRLEHDLHPWVAFAIMPVFALANAGISLDAGAGAAATSGIALGVTAGLLLGKPIGVMAATALVVKLGLGERPQSSTWRQTLGAACLSGIGFTMSFFIANLAFRDGDQLQLAKVGILFGSLIAGVVGFVMLRTAPSAQEPTAVEGADG